MVHSTAFTMRKMQAPPMVNRRYFAASFPSPFSAA
jgi:hypothetical protein